MILEIKEAGQEAMLSIATAEIVEGKYGEQVKFETNMGDILYAPVSSVTRQLDRMGVAEISEIAGMDIHVSRAANKNGGAPYWNFDKAREGDTVQPPKAAKPVVADALPAKQAPLEIGRLPGDEPGFDDTAFGQLCQKYRECVSVAHEAWGKDCGDDALVAAAATLFIARNQQKI